jgi:hypothetical protein
MRIFTLRRMLGIAAIGVAYVHGKRGGDATLASISDTLNYCWSSTCERLGIDKRPQRPMPQRATTSRMPPAPNGLERNPRPSNG